MKKILCLLISLFILSLNHGVVFAKNSEELYAFTLQDTSGYDEYASSRFAEFTYTNYGYIDSTLELGNGIYINSNDDYPKLLYPVWRNNEIIGSFIVVNVDNIYSGTYSELYANRLNAIRKMTDEKTPLKLVVDDSIYAYVQGNYYSLLDESVVDSINSFAEAKEFYKVINSKDKIQYNITNNSRYLANYSLPWTIYSTQPGYDDDHCAHYCLYNIFRNMGINSISLSSIFNDLPVFNGVRLENTCNYLSSKGFTYNSNSSSLGFSSVSNALSSGGYINIVTARQIEANQNFFRHGMVLFGCSTVQSSGNQYYKVWDPTSNTTFTMDAYTRIVVINTAYTFAWNSGTIYNISR